MTETAQVDIGSVKVMIGMPCKGDMPPQTVMSLVKSVSFCASRGVQVDFTVEICGVVEIGRDEVIDDFLRSPNHKLFWIDSDMVWEPEDFVRLVALSTKVDVVGAAYPAKVEGKTTFYAAYDANPKREDYGLMEIKGLGLGFTIMDRSVIEQLAAKAPRVRNQLTGTDVAGVFRVDVINGERRTEDMAFFADIRDLGHKIWLDPTIELGHMGPRMWRGRMLDALKAPDTEIAAPYNIVMSAA